MRKSDCKSLGTSNFPSAGPSVSVLCTFVAVSFLKPHRVWDISGRWFRWGQAMQLLRSGLASTKSPRTTATPAGPVDPKAPAAEAPLGSAPWETLPNPPERAPRGFLHHVPFKCTYHLQIYKLLPKSFFWMQALRWFSWNMQRSKHSLSRCTKKHCQTTQQIYS